MSRSVAGLGATMLLTGGGYLGMWSERTEPIVVRVNKDDSLLSRWPSEEFGSPLDAPPECAFWNASIVYARTLCNHFTISRAATAPARARQRALACAGAYGAECVLSPEVGLGIPAAFLYENRDNAEMTTIVAPRLIPRESDQRYIRVAPPDGDGVIDTRTFLLNASVEAEYMDGDSRQLRTRVFEGEAAFCVQLLRHAFEEACWAELD